jgi:hypothetical protein
MLAIYALGSLVLLAVVGVIRLRRLFARCYRERDDTLEFYSALNKALVGRQAGNSDLEAMDYLMQHVEQVQGMLGQRGLVTRYAPFSSRADYNYQLLVNVVGQLASQHYSEDELRAAAYALHRHVGYLNSFDGALKVLIRNPLKWIQEGIQAVLSLPLYLLEWFGLAPSGSSDAAASSRFVTILAGVINLVASIVTLVLGAQEILKFFH